VSRGLARTGVVGTLRAGSSKRTLGLRADMDCLPIAESNEFEHRSQHENRMHACGHDGHTTMLLGAARHLATTRAFDGTVHFIFQPAEERGGGGQVMVREGLFEQFDCEAVYGMHNLPGLAAGEFAMRAGPTMAAVDEFDLTIRGVGGHAAAPHRAVDPVLAQAHVVTALQAVVARTLDPLSQAVLSVTQVHGGDAYNVIPDFVTLKGTVRTFLPEVRRTLFANLERIAREVSAAFGARAEIVTASLYPATVNTAAETQKAARAAMTVVGKERVNTGIAPLMFSEDFAYMLQARPGSYIFIGNGASSGEGQSDVKGSCMLHSSRYDFNDDVLTLGASYWSALVEQELARQ
jgi:hippurate hydrolase